MKMKVLLLICMCVMFLNSVAHGSYKYGPYTTSSVTKTTPIPAKTSESPVIEAQTTVPVLYSLSTRLLAGFAHVTYNVLASKPVYRKRYFQYGTEITIPKDRAVRVHFVEKSMTGPNNTKCLYTKPQSLVQNYEKLNPLVITKISYADTNQIAQTTNYVYLYSENKTIGLNSAMVDKSVQLWTSIKFNGSIVANTTCTQVIYLMNGTMVRLFESNPDADSTPNAGAICMSSLWMTMLSVVLCFAGKLG